MPDKDMKEPSQATGKLRGVAALFNDYERKELFKKYLFFLGWIEILIFASFWLYQLGDSGVEHFGQNSPGFPWKTYFLISFLAPVGITFLVGVIVVGFNKYFSDEEAPVHAEGEAATGTDASGKIQQLNHMVRWLQRLPFLGLLLLLVAVAVFFYKLDLILEIIGAVGEKSVRILLICSAIVLAVGSVFALILIILNYQLRKKSMEYQYKSEMAERFGLIILEDNTVIDRDGKLLISGKKWKESTPLLAEKASDTKSNEPARAGVIAPPCDLEVT